jgi:hypothetical protein
MSLLQAEERKIACLHHSFCLRRTYDNVLVTSDESGLRHRVHPILLTQTVSTIIDLLGSKIEFLLHL